MRSSGKLPLLIALTCVSMLVLRVGGAHLHLCLDGGEPPMSLHLGDSGLHHVDVDAEHAGVLQDAPHTDQDVRIAADVLIKKQIDLGTLAILFAVLLVILLSRRRSLLPELLHLPFFAHAPVRLWPPLRGPPR